MVPISLARRVFSWKMTASIRTSRVSAVAGSSAAAAAATGAPPAPMFEAVWPSVVFVSALFLLVALGTAQGIHRGRNAELALGISQSEKVQ